MRRPIIAGNWKMFKTLAETRAFFDALIPEILGVEHFEIVVAPPFTALATAAVEADGTRVSIAAQDVFWEQQGAFTGEIAVKMLVDAGWCCRWYRSPLPWWAAAYSESPGRWCRHWRRASCNRLRWRDTGGARCRPGGGRGSTSDSGRTRKVFSSGAFPHHRCIRACMGHRHRAHGNAGSRRRNARRNPKDPR